MIEPARPPPKRAPVSGRILTWWFALMSAAGVCFGLFANKQAFGDDVLAHPLVIFFCAAVAVALLALRFALRRPLADFIPDRLLLFGCFVGLAGFLIGHWLAVNLAALR